MFAAILAALTNPAVDAALVQAASGLVSWFASLPEKDKQKIIAQVDAAARSATGQLSGFDADMAQTRAHIDTLAAHPAVVANAEVAKVVSDLRARFEAPLPVPQLVKDPA